MRNSSPHPGIADSMKKLGAETAFMVLAKAKELERKGAKVVHFEIGEPDFDTPEHIKEAANKALKEGYTHYTPSPGLIELREAIAEWESKERGIDIDPATEVIVMPGAKPGLFMGLLATVNPGEEVIVPNPCFPVYDSVVNYLGAKPIYVPLKEENEFRLDPDDVRKAVTKKTKMIMINYPHNPCGSSLLKGEVKELAEIAKEHDLWVLSDEVYSKIVYGGEHHSIVSEPGMKERTILLNGFSKTYAMTGWRLGYAVGNKEVIENMVKLQVNIVSCVAAFIQRAGIAALMGPQDAVRKMVSEYRKRSKVIADGLNSIPGVSCTKPIGAFYVFPNVKKLGLDPKILADLLLNKAHVATLSGRAFGPHGDGYLRLSYATSIKHINTGLERIKEFAEDLLKKPSARAR